ncbi:hypothetical protein M1N21_00340 [Dehalococcoidia bacterium]|nr:hypothetical protein [Dehalococcoidia bacterium]
MQVSALGKKRTSSTCCAGGKVVAVLSSAGVTIEAIHEAIQQEMEKQDEQ